MIRGNNYRLRAEASGMEMYRMAHRSSTGQVRDDRPGDKLLNVPRVQRKRMELRERAAVAGLKSVTDGSFRSQAGLAISCATNIPQLQGYRSSLVISKCIMFIKVSSSSQLGMDGKRRQNLLNSERAILSRAIMTQVLG
ncbi:hypothetical protein PoB_007224500 [Plakobranchus ocellatus]|uniref:Uncharacterized protein n=1 Tax=Plakobranchus ocellatus TaxID=259542 RepID=A0AAV4DP87_9GAST|nr:hypothetical protein PoB_007224500 [Plakobranchus ocellatus]